jgi:hypothetical protein
MSLYIKLHVDYEYDNAADWHEEKGGDVKFGYLTV